jgi:hypothetical protein
LPGSLIPNIPSLSFAANVSDRHGHRFTILATTGSCSCQEKNNGGLVFGNSYRQLSAFCQDNGQL